MESVNESDGQSANRSRRRVSRINYAEDNAPDESPNTYQPEELSNKSSPGSTDEFKGVKKSLAHITKQQHGSKRGLSGTEDFPMNWQPKTSIETSGLAMLDLKDATVELDNSLHLADGTVYSPEGVWKCVISDHY